MSWVACRRSVSLAQAGEHVRALSPGLFEATLPPGYSPASLDIYRGFRFTAVDASHGVSRLRAAYESPLWLLLGTTGLILLLTLANLATLMLARAHARRRELAMLVALGASRGRLISQIVIEALLLSGAGVALGPAARDRGGPAARRDAEHGVRSAACRTGHRLARRRRGRDRRGRDGIGVWIVAGVPVVAIRSAAGVAQRRPHRTRSIVAARRCSACSSSVSWPSASCSWSRPCCLRAASTTSRRPMSASIRTGSRWWGLATRSWIACRSRSATRFSRCCSRRSNRFRACSRPGP